MRWDDIADPPAVLDDGPERIGDLVQIGRLGPQHTRRSIGIGDKRTDRLIDFMRNRRRQLTDGYDAVDMRELDPRIAEFFSGQCLLGEIARDCKRRIHPLRLQL
jgi:hypothetical protein